MGSNSLCVFQQASVAQVGRDAGCPEGVAADARGQSSLTGSAFDHSQYVGTPSPSSDCFATATTGRNPLASAATTFQSFGWCSTWLTHGFSNHRTNSSRHRAGQHEQAVALSVFEMLSQVVQSRTNCRVSALQRPATASRTANRSVDETTE